MRRTTPLKRTQMAARKVPLARSGRLPYRSRKTADVYRRVRVPLVAEILATTPRCEYPRCWRQPTDVHERLRRSQGGSITDRANLVALCREHHDEVTFHARPWMYLHGLLERAGGGVPVVKIPHTTICQFCAIYGNTSCDPCRCSAPASSRSTTPRTCHEPPARSAHLRRLRQTQLRQPSPRPQGGPGPVPR